MPVLNPGGKPLGLSREVELIMQEGNALSSRLDAMTAVLEMPEFAEADMLDKHLFTLQMDAMRTYLHVLSIRIARASDKAKGAVDVNGLSALGGKKTIIKPN